MKNLEKLRNWKVGIGVVVIIVLIIVIVYNINPEVQACIMDLKSSLTKPRIIPGEIILKFMGHVTRDEAVSVINSYGLQSKFIGEFFNQSSFIIYVPNGTEANWLCRFRLMYNDIIGDVYPQYNIFNDDIQKCINSIGYYPTNPSNESRYKRTPGKILVRLYQNASQEDAQSLIDLYDLSGWVDWSIVHFLHIDVPFGSESQWICQFEVFHADMVKDAFPSYLLYPM